MIASRTLLACVALTATAVSAPVAQTQPTQAPSFGTATVSGVVVSSDESARPIRRATVTLAGKGEINRSAITDDDGRFAISLVPAGSYTLTVSKPAHLAATYGAKGPGRPGTPLVVKDGQTIADIRLPLTRGAVLTGTVRDDSGAGVPDVQVYAVRADRPATGQEILEISGAVEAFTTDDTGTYRIFGLVAGSYVVAAAPRSTLSSEVAIRTRDQIDAELRALQQRGSANPPAAPEPDRRRFTYAPIFHPATSDPSQAATITLGPGEERRGIDVVLAFVPVGTISGMVVDPGGRPATAVALNLRRAGLPVPSALIMRPVIAPRPAADGTFSHANVTPGAYVLSALSTAQIVTKVGDSTRVTGSITDLPPGAFYWASATVEMRGADVPGVTLTLRPGMTMTGSVRFDGAALKPPADLTQVAVMLTAEKLEGPQMQFFNQPGPAPTGGPVKADGTFEIKGLVPGIYALSGRVPGPPQSWWLRSALVDGRDLLDRPIEFVDADVANAVVTFTDRHTEISGELATSAGQPATDFVVVVIPEDRALWTSTRRIQKVRPATNGRFSFADLPPGTYLLAALTDVPDENWRTKEFLEAVAPAGVNVKVELGEGERRVQNLRVGR